MKLGEFFEKSGRTAYGPWLAILKNFFSAKELNQKINESCPEDIIEDNIRIKELKDKIIIHDCRAEFVNGTVEGEESIEKIKEELLKIEKKVLNTPYKAIVISSNNVKEVQANANISSGEEKIERYKEKMIQVFNYITNKQMRDFHKFITNLPENNNKWSNYFQQIEEEKGYDPINALRNVPYKNELVAKFENHRNDEYKDHYEDIKKGVEELSKFYDITDEVLVSGNTLYNYGCENI